MMNKIGILHPGQMGVSVAASARQSGGEVWWVSEGRSPETRARAEAQELVESKTLAELCKACGLIVSVCPPHAAEDLADQVLETGYRGLYLDANAISPARTQRIGAKMTARGVVFVDGGIIGGPAWEAGKTRLYLSGAGADEAAECFSAGPLGTRIIGTDIGQASALKMCFAAYTKGSTALLCAILAAAEDLGIRQDLEKQWSLDGSDFALRTNSRVRGVTAKAWRFTGEMDEIADTFETVGLPGGFHRSAAQIYARIASFKGKEEPPALEDVLKALLSQAE